MFLVSIFVMSAATFGMGLVPTFATWGPTASVLMVSAKQPFREVLQAHFRTAAAPAEQPVAAR